jgi:hypothetical protein
MEQFMPTKQTTKPAASATEGKPPLLSGSTADALFELREKKRKLEESVKAIDGQIDGLQSELLEAMEAAGTEKLSGKHATVSISSAVVANVTDWDALYPYIAKNKFWHLLQRRVSDPAYRELLEANKKIPGVQPFSKKRLNLRAVSSS